MAVLKCEFCRGIILEHKHKYNVEPILIVCAQCKKKGLLIPSLMSKYQLTYKSEVIEQRVVPQCSHLPLPEVDENIIFTTLNQTTRRLVTNFARLKEKMINQSPRMMNKITNSICRIMEKTERQVKAAILAEVQELRTMISDLDQMNQNKISQVETLKMNTIDEINELRDEEGLIFRNEQRIEVLNFFNNKIISLNNIHTSLTQLMSESSNFITSGGIHEANQVEISITSNQSP